MRECLQDVFDVPGLTDLMRDLESRAVRLIEVETTQPSPFAKSLLFGYVAQFLYEGDSPLAERRAAALALDTGLLAELLGQAELRELLDETALAAVEADLQRLSDGRPARNVEEAADLLRILGPLSTEEARERGVEAAWLVELEGVRRAIRVRLAGTERWAAIEDAGRLRDALGAALPDFGIPEAFLEPVADPVADLVARHARTHGPFTTSEVAERLGLGTAVVLGALHRLAASGRVVEGELRPGGSGSEWCDAEVLRLLRRRSLAALRQEAEPVPTVALARFLPAWQNVGSPLRGVDGVLRVVEQRFQGAPLPASALERLVLPARVRDYQPALLDELTTAGEVLWCGHGSLPGDDGWISLHLAENAPLTLPLVDPVDALLESGTPFLAVCLGHQVLCDRLGIPLTYKDIVFQGTQSTVEIDGRLERVGFYNTFVGRAGDDIPPGVKVESDPETGDVHLVAGPHFRGVQFHAESILTENGFALLRGLLLELLG